MRYRRLRIAGATYFFTLVTRGRAPFLADPSNIALLLQCFEHVGRGHPFEMVAYVVLHDHVHTLWQLPEGDDNYSTRWRLIKERFTREYGKLSAAPQRVWQNRFWEHVIRDERDFLEHLDYIHFNPVQHGYVAAPIDWPHSSFKNWIARGHYEPRWGADEMPALPAWASRRRD